MDKIKTIDIYSDDGKITPMEVVLVFKIEEYKSNYIVYRELDKSKTYIAKFRGDKMLDLDTNLTDEELKLCNKFFKEVSAK